MTAPQFQHHRRRTPQFDDSQRLLRGCGKANQSHLLPRHLAAHLQVRAVNDQRQQAAAGGGLLKADGFAYSFTAA
jgi:hypothetical protein